MSPKPPRVAMLEIHQQEVPNWKLAFDYGKKEEGGRL